MLNSEVIAMAKAHLQTARHFPYPPGLTVDTVWQHNQQKILRSLDSFKECANTIQRANGLPFNHRTNVIPDLVEWKMEMLHGAFPGFNLADSPYFEHPDAVPQSLDQWHGYKLSNIFPWHLYPVLACRKYLCAKPRRVLEIGGGGGELARLWHMADPSLQYIDIDLPESLFYAEVFLRWNLSEANIQYITDVRQDIGGADIVLCPAQLATAIPWGHVDIAINQGSMQEMPAETVDYWLRWLEVTDVDTFYSVNYAETPLCRAQTWELLRRIECPPVLTLDSGVDLEQGWRIRRPLA